MWGRKKDSLEYVQDQVNINRFTCWKRSLGVSDKCQRRVSGESSTVTTIIGEECVNLNDSKVRRVLRKEGS